MVSNPTVQSPRFCLFEQKYQVNVLKHVTECDQSTMLACRYVSDSVISKEDGNESLWNAKNKSQ